MSFPPRRSIVATIDQAFLLAALVFLIGCFATRAPVAEPTEPVEPIDLTGMPEPDREFRGVWVATVANIDWPSQPGLPAQQQQAELVALLDQAVAMNFNTIVFQVRPAADALYVSELEPWSEYLTGEMGKPPVPFYDPLAFAVEEAHKRGVELHAWFNPYRARHATGRSPASPGHISRTRPEVVRTYGQQRWLDPGEPAAEEHTVAVILDVVRRYDIDGIHFDDYFYPYQIKNGTGYDIPFPDDRSWQLARETGEQRNRDDWRRYNVDRLVERLYREIKQAKPWVKFGISPFGIWRPGHPEQIKGYDAYAKLYADSRKWLREGWVDYFSPQLYWKIAEPDQSYPILLEWWDAQNQEGRHLWPGNFTSRIANEERGDWYPREILDQIRLTRAQPGATGNVHFSMISLMENRRRIADSLTTAVYARPALVPASPWLSQAPPGKPTVVLHAATDGPTLTMTPAKGEVAWLWVVRARYGDTWTTHVVPGRQRIYTLEMPQDAGTPDAVTVSVVDRVGIEGPVAVAEPPTRRDGTSGW